MKIAWAKREIIDQLEASINASIILHSDVEKFKKTQELRRQLDPLYNATALAKQKEVTDSEIVHYLVQEKLIAQQFPKTDDEVKKEIQSIEINNHLSSEDLKEALAKGGFQFDDYFELIRSSGSKKDLIDREIRTRVTISEEDIKNYFYNHYSTDPKVSKIFHIQVISLSKKSFKAKTDSGARFLAEKNAKEALKQIKKGESFSEVAKRFSDDESAPLGGELGELSEDQLSPFLRKSVQNLKIGQVSGVIGTLEKDRFYILKLLDLKSNQMEQLNQMRETIKNELTTREYEHQIELWLERQKQSAFIHLAGDPPLQGVPVGL